MSFRALLLNENKADLLNRQNLTFYSILDPEDVIPANELFYLYESMDNLEDTKALASLFLILLDVQIKLIYTSIYEETFLMDEPLNSSIDVAFLKKRWGI